MLNFSYAFGRLRPPDPPYQGSSHGPHAVGSFTLQTLPQNPQSWIQNYARVVMRHFDACLLVRTDRCDVTSVNMTPQSDHWPLHTARYDDGVIH